MHKGIIQIGLILTLTFLTCPMFATTTDGSKVIASMVPAGARIVPSALKDEFFILASNRKSQSNMANVANKKEQKLQKQANALSTITAKARNKKLTKDKINNQLLRLKQIVKRHDKPLLVHKMAEENNQKRMKLHRNRVVIKKKFLTLPGMKIKSIKIKLALNDAHHVGKPR